MYSKFFESINCETHNLFKLLIVEHASIALLEAYGIESIMSPYHYFLFITIAATIPRARWISY